MLFCKFACKKGELLFSLLPILRKEEEKNGVDFKTSYKHIETHEPFASGWHHTKIAGWPGNACARTYIAEHAYAATQSAVYIGTHKREGYHADNNKHKVDENKT